MAAPQTPSAPGKQCIGGKECVNDKGAPCEGVAGALCHVLCGAKEMNGMATVTESRSDLDAPPNLRRMLLPPSAPSCENVSSGKPSANFVNSDMICLQKCRATPPPTAQIPPPGEIR